LVITLAMVGSLFAFLRFNRSPARIFLGDSGSMVLGFFLSIRLVTAATTPDGLTFFLVPLFALAYPLLDTFIAIARRWLRGHPFSRADGRHIHHQILALGLSARRTVDLLGLFFACVAFLGVSITFAPPRVTLTLMTAGGVLIFAVFFYAIRWLRYTEFIELGASIASVIRNARGHVRNKIVATDIAMKLNKANTLEEFSAILNESAEELGLLEVNLVLGSGNQFIGPSSRQIWPAGNRPYRVDYPITWERDGHRQDAVLRIWCERPDGRRHHGTERIAARLAPAIEGWFTNTPVSVPRIEDVRTSGQHSLAGHHDDDRRTSGSVKHH
jgi:UDP-GlcNAc:undecaprenyl-phosphate GlcNAc-1-phosphate transferase